MHIPSHLSSIALFWWTLLGITPYLSVTKNISNGSKLSTDGYFLVAKKIRYEKCLCCRITTAMYAVQFLYILALFIHVTVLSILLFLFRIYILFRDGGEISDLCLTIISHSLIMTVYIFALIVSIRWKYMIDLKIVKFG
uniref:Uncharacterized protein n=1 Tax=Elaeophora elaphi TaxID=1147741 RepID=A0A0R3RX46_9BILA